MTQRGSRSANFETEEPRLGGERAGRLAQVVALALSALPPMAHSEGFDTFTQLDKLEGKAIVKADNIRQLTMVNLNTPDPYAARPPKWYQLGQYCFKSAGLEELNGKAGLILVDQLGILSVAVITESIGSVKVTTQQISAYDCAALMRQQAQDMNEDLNRQIEALKRQREAIEKLRNSLQQKGKAGGAP